MNCNSCGKPIFFAKTINGKNTPIDAGQCADGNMVVREGIALVAEASPGEARYRSHYATCPNASKHRKAK